MKSHTDLMTKVTIESRQDKIKHCSDYECYFVNVVSCKHQRYASSCMAQPLTTGLDPPHFVAVPWQDWISNVICHGLFLSNEKLEMIVCVFDIGGIDDNAHCIVQQMFKKKGSEVEIVHVRQ